MPWQRISASQICRLCYQCLLMMKVPRHMKRVLVIQHMAAAQCRCNKHAMPGCACPDNTCLLLPVCTCIFKIEVQDGSSCLSAFLLCRHSCQATSSTDGPPDVWQQLLGCFVPHYTQLQDDVAGLRTQVAAQQQQLQQQSLALSARDAAAATAGDSAQLAHQQQYQQQ